jgi:hypothetical protein
VAEDKTESFGRNRKGTIGGDRDFPAAHYQRARNRSPEDCADQEDRGSGVMAKWRAIETAPKNGAPILVWTPDTKPRDGAFVVVYWCGCQEEWQLADGDHDSWEGATHWMPLLAPPKAAE